MHYEAYCFTSNSENTRFQFQSVGKRGVFEKVIFITAMSDDIYNLALVDYNVETEEYNDISVTDNGDMPEVLATVLKAVTIFLNINPTKTIYFEGSSPARTRLYQIAISKIYNYDESEFLIQGSKGENWSIFEPNINFESFLIKKKRNLNY
ncbi:DUF6934 family protein [Dyadobacter psychrophilus]|uniref:Uncharacterized protein n=1 Tax=Dyadobacter psychrophilus TaxID=651661 RepID=A0A1T5CH10_9BACT|nr:hypothetical protein [Dyadobacter psychrophilus]SKB58782.1 hypothetical protein SAMN05660293_01255 [Dyadobacter psychrophilus]